MAKVWARLTFTTMIGVPRYSWTEKHYSTAASIDASISGAIKLAEFRSQLLGAGVFMGPITVGDDDAPRAGQTIDPIPYHTSAGGIIYYNTNFTPPSDASSEGGLTNEPYASLLVRKVGVGNYRANLYMGGNPDVHQRVNIPRITSIAWNNAFTNFVNYVRGWEGGVQQPGGPPWGMKVTKGVALNPWVAVTNITAPIAPNLQFVVRAAVDLPAGQHVVIIKGVREQFGPGQTRSINGRWIVRATGTPADGYTVLNYPRDQINVNWQYLGGGQFRRLESIVVGYTTLVQVRFGRRDRGSSLFSVRGRRRTRRSALSSTPAGS